MKATQSLTAAITAVALVAGAGFAYAQTASPSADTAGPITQQSPSSPATGDTSSTGSTTLQAQPSTSGTTMDNSASTVQPEPMAPRADRN